MVCVNRRLLLPFLSQALIFSGAPNLCARFTQSMALRSKLEEKRFLLAVSLLTAWSSCHRSLLGTFAQWAEERHCLKYSSGVHFVVLRWQAAWARQRRVVGSLSACAFSSASESFIASLLAMCGPPRTNRCLPQPFLLPAPGRGLARRSKSGDVDQRVTRASR